MTASTTLSGVFMSSEWNGRCSDDELMIAARCDVGAFEELIRRYQERAIRLARFWLRDRRDAEEAAFTAFMRVYDLRQKYEPRGKFWPFLSRIVHFVCLEIIGSGGPPSGGPPPPTPDSAPDPEERSIRNDQLNKALTWLPEKDREILIDVLVGLSAEEIARLRGLPAATVRTIKHRAVARLLKKLKKEKP